MGKAAKEQLNRALSEHLNIIHETLQMFDQMPASSLEKVGWEDVTQMGEQVSKQATAVGMLYGGESPGVQALEESMTSYFNMLRVFLFLSHGSLVGAGATLSSCIHKSVKQVVDTSFMLLQEAVSSYGTSSKAQKQKIPHLVGAVWDACSAIKKTPTTNVTAIGRALTQVAVSVKDVLREMNELKPASSNEASEDVSKAAEDKSSDGDSDGDLGNDLSPEEMIIVRFTSSVVSEILMVLKELIRSITSLLKHESSGNDDVSATSLEKLLKLSQVISLQVDELGACLYPPQEMSGMKMALEKISSFITEIETELDDLKALTDNFCQACSGLRVSVRKLESELDIGHGDDIAQKLENLTVSS